MRHIHVKNISAPLRSGRVKLVLLVRRHKKVSALLGVAVLVVFAGCISILIQARPAVTVGKESYSRREYNLIIADARTKGDSEVKARIAIKDNLGARAAAKILGVAYSLDEARVETRARFLNDINDKSAPSIYQKMNAETALIVDYIRLNERGGYDATVLDFPFSRYIIGSPSNDLINQKLGNVDLIKSDIDYARTTSQAVLTKINKDKLSTTRALSGVISDNRLLYGQISNPSSRMLIEHTDIDESNDLGVAADVLSSGTDQGTAVLKEVRMNYSPDIYAKGINNIRRDDGIQVAWRIVYVHKKYEQKPGLESAFTLKKEELINDAR